MKASIIIVTRNRATDLQQTLESMRRVAIPDGLALELLVVDNGSSDATPQVVENWRCDGVSTRYVHEVRRGLAHGRNRGLEEATGDFMLFTDDDIRPPSGWLHGMLAPLVDGRAEAVSGGVVLAPALLRPWMTSLHRSWLASTEWLGSGTLRHMVGANMGIARRVLQRVPRFDGELGAGALGSGEEVLFAQQLVEAGYRIHNCLATCVEHHFDRARLQRQSWLAMAANMGASQAYIGHHWEHWRCRMGHARLWRQSARLALWRARHPEPPDGEGCSEAEVRLVMQRALVRAHLEESRRSRNYDRHGLVKIRQSNTN